MTIQKRMRALTKVESSEDVTLSVPLLIRLFEYARETAGDDEALHHVAERAAVLGRPLTMDDYGFLVPSYQPTPDKPDAPPA